MLTAGELRHRVTIQARAETSDGHGGFTDPTWSTVRSRVAAKVRPLAGRDLERARQIDPRVSHEVTLRYWRDYPTDLDGGRTRLLYHPSSNSSDDRTFEIVTPPIDVEERHEALQVMCREAA